MTLPTTPDGPDGPDVPDDATGGGDTDPLSPDAVSGGGFDLGSMLSSAMEMQSQMATAQAEAGSALIEGHAGGGVVRIEVTGGFEFRSVTIDPSAVDPEDIELLQDLVLAALNDAMAQVDAIQRQSLGGIGDLLGGGGLGDLLGGGGLGELGGMLGLSPETADLLLDQDLDDEQDDGPAGDR